MTPFEPTTVDPEPIDADGYCLLCWGYCGSYEECATNRRNRDSRCSKVEPHKPHGWQEGWSEEFYCDGRKKPPQPQRLW